LFETSVGVYTYTCILKNKLKWQNGC